MRRPNAGQKVFGEGLAEPGCRPMQIAAVLRAPVQIVTDTEGLFGASEGGCALLQRYRPGVGTSLRVTTRVALGPGDSR